MADLLRQGSQWLEQMRTAHCSSPVEYRRPPEFWTVQATFGKTGFEVADESGLTIKAQVWDFFFGFAGRGGYAGKPPRRNGISLPVGSLPHVPPPALRV